MAFGVNNIVKYGFFRTVYHFFKKWKYLNKYKGKNLKFDFGVYISNVKMGRSVFIGAHSSISNSEIGDYSYLNSNVKIKDTTIGKFCSIGPGVKIVLGNHPITMVSTHPAFYSNNKPFETFSDKMYFDEYKGVIIGNDVWIGENVLIPGGIRIGDGAVITSGAIVTKDVEPYSVVGGVPAKLIKYRFDQDVRVKLLQIKWWDKDVEWLKQNYKLMHEPSNLINNLDKL